MTDHNAPQDLFKLTLREGLPVVRDGKPIFYKQVELREIDLADERWAVRAAERLVLWQGEPKLVLSNADHKLALTLRHIKCFRLAGIGEITLDEIDLDLAGKLKPVDVALIEDRVFLIELAIKVRYGEIPQSKFEEYLKGSQGSSGDLAPQPVGPTAAAGEPGSAAGSGPVMLADRTGRDSAGTDQGASARA